MDTHIWKYIYSPLALPSSDEETWNQNSEDLWSDSWRHTRQNNVTTGNTKMPHGMIWTNWTIEIAFAKPKELGKKFDYMTIFEANHAKEDW